MHKSRVEWTEGNNLQWPMCFRVKFFLLLLRPALCLSQHTLRRGAREPSFTLELRLWCQQQRELQEVVTLSGGAFPRQRLQTSESTATLWTSGANTYCPVLLRSVSKSSGGRRCCAILQIPLSIQCQVNTWGSSDDSNVNTFEGSWPLRATVQ